MNSLETRLREAREEMNARLEDAQLENAQRRKGWLDETFANIIRMFPSQKNTWRAFHDMETDILKVEYALVCEPTLDRLIPAINEQWRCSNSESSLLDSLERTFPERKSFASHYRDSRSNEAKRREFEYLSFWLTADWLQRREKKIIHEATRVGGSALCVSAWLEEVLQVRHVATLPFSG